MMYRRLCAGLVCLATAAALCIAGFSGSYVVPLDHDAIQYAKTGRSDAVAQLEKRLAIGEISLPYQENLGFLPAVLNALQIPAASQVLVFSKTSFQSPRIAPRTPRAIYFNDAVSVGFVRSGDVLEIAALDPKQGVIFYTLDQDSSVKPHFERRDSCLQCHQSGSTVGVPGLMVRSVFPEPSGMPLFQAGSFVTDHRSPLGQRWGGWYVSGTHGSQRHMGNAVVPDKNDPGKLETEGTQNVADLAGKFDTGAYLTPHSDIVALMVLEHQTHATNLLTRVGWETRMARHTQVEMNKILGRPADEVGESASRRINSGVEELLGYLLFTDEQQLTEPIKGTSGFAEAFTSRGPKDKQGRSLRDLQLTGRLFRYPCSYLIYSNAFDSLPEPAKGRLYRRLHEILTGADTTGKFARLTPEDLKAVLQILLETKPDLPDYWRQPAQG